MKVWSKIVPMKGAHLGDCFPTGFSPPEGAVQLTTALLVVDSVPCLAVSWVELTPAERADLMRQQQGGLIR